MGKKTSTSPESGWGTIQILIYPAGTEIPPPKLGPVNALFKTTGELPNRESPSTGPKP